MCHFAQGIDREQLYQLSSELKRLADAMIPPPADGDPPAAELVRAIIRTRRMRERYLGYDIFADPAWDMLLDLYAAGLEHKQVSVSSLCLASRVPGTTALRWITVLESKGHVTRVTDTRDRRRIFIELTDATAENLQAFLAAEVTSTPLMT